MTSSRVNSKKVNLYVDGFNLYRRALENTSYKWLDLELLAELLIKNYEINRIRYFTALINTQSENPNSAQRQQIYLRALGTNPKISIHYGLMTTKVKLMILHPVQLNDSGEVLRAKVKKTEEKGSDVNLASHMILDASRSDADAYVLVSSDSDFSSSLHILKDELKVPIGLISPTSKPSRSLLTASPTIFGPIRDGVLLAAQFPDQVVDKNGRIITKPQEWKKGKGPKFL